ncbi:hypothetical protein ABAC402_14465 [Asticcacaulis sp. AC402]|nr:hypothetical protein ABAC402_14465 [Asticcacaulis sp. AC402]
MMIAAQARPTGAVLVTHDKAFQHISPHLTGLENWTAEDNR